MRLSVREKLMVCILGWALISYLFYIYDYTPLNRQAAAWTKKNHWLGQQLMAARRSDKNLEHMIDQQKAKQEDYTTLVRQIPSQDYIPETVAFIEDVADENGLTLMLVNCQNEEREKSSSVKDSQSDSIDVVRNINFNLIGRGNYYNAITFIEAIEEAPRIYNISEAALAADKRRPAASLKMSEGETPSSQTTGSGSSIEFDPENIVLTLKFRAYSDGQTVPLVKDVVNPIEQTFSQRDNPFSP